jgi:hypothetical protein
MKKFRTNILRYATGGTFFLTPLLVIIFLIEKNTYFNLKTKNSVIVHNIEQEKLRSANLTLSFTQNQNHQKILDLRKRYTQDFRYIESKDIINENQIEFL